MVLIFVKPQVLKKNLNNVLCISTRKCMFVYVFTWLETTKTLENHHNCTFFIMHTSSKKYLVHT